MKMVVGNCQWGTSWELPTRPSRAIASCERPRELTANARSAFNDRFARQVDPTAPSQQPNDSAEPAATSFNTYSPSVSFASCNTLTPEA